MAAYLNQNFYGNRSYGIKAAAKSYFGIDDLSKLTLAQAAILAGIPQSPTTFDLVKNAEETCAVTGRRGRRLPGRQDPARGPRHSAIVERRNKILDLMKTRSRPDRRPVHRRRLRSGQEGTGHPPSARLGRTGWRPTSSGRSATSSA